MPLRPDPVRVRFEEAEGDRVCAQLRGQLAPARELIREAQAVLGGVHDTRGELRPAERRSFRRDRDA